jgi:hypothetical protein
MAMKIVIFLLFVGFMIKAAFILTNVRICKKDRTLRGGYLLTISEAFHIFRQRLSSEPHPFIISPLQEETLKLYVEVRRELRFRNQWKKDRIFVKTLFKTCRKIILQKSGFSSEQSEATDLNKDILSVIHEKTAVLQDFTENEKKTLYKQDTNLWQARYAYLTDNFTANEAETFYKAICELGAMSHVRQATLRKIYFQAYQFLAGHSKIHSLMCYLHYLNAKTSKTFKSRTINKSFSRLLFRDEPQKRKFLQIKENLLATNDLNQAIESLKQLYGFTRKKVELDESAIKEAGEKQTQVSELLGKYLSDEEKPVLLNVNTAPQATVPLTSIAGNNENGLFQLFEQNDYKLDIKKINIFADENGIFRDSFILHINEKYFDELDDLLIETEADVYFLNKKYYEQIKK